MSNERQQDDIVSAAYRDLAQEKTPAHLDDNVLRKAARHKARAPYMRSISWTRPLAWVASIALCLAITLEVLRTSPSVDQPPRLLSSPALPAANAPAPEAATSIAAPPTVEAEQDAAALYTREDRDQSAAADSIASDVEIKSADPRQQLEGIVPLQSSPKRRVAEERMADMASAQGPRAHCSAEVRAEPSTWLECVEAFQENGESEAAEYELELLMEAFPDFIVP